MIIDTHVTWSVDDHPDLITRDILVKPGGKLEILAGTQIPFLPGSETVCDPAGNMKRNPSLIVEGSLVVRGNEGGIVSFVPSDSSATVFGRLQLSDKEPGQGECFIEWASFGQIRIDGYAPWIAFCDIEYLYLENSKDVEIVANNVRKISALYCDGVIAENIVSEGIYLWGDSLAVRRNQISGYGTGDMAGIKSSGSSRAYITENCLLDCGIGIEIFSGSPTINFNDFVNCETNIVVIPFMDSPEADTINAQHNWWDSTIESEILGKIEYRPNGGTESGKVILIDPYEMHPWMVCH